MKLRFFLCFFILIFFSTCKAEIDYEKLAFKIVKQKSKPFEKIRGYQIFGLGGATGKNVKIIDVCYVCKSEVNIDQARFQFVEIAEELINAFNANEKIRPYLNNYPFNINNLEASILFFDKNNRYTEKGNIALVSSINGKIFYAIHDLDELKDFYEESYEDALKIYNQEKLKRNIENIPQKIKSKRRNEPTDYIK